MNEFHKRHSQMLLTSKQAVSLSHPVLQPWSRTVSVWRQRRQTWWTRCSSFMPHWRAGRSSSVTSYATMSSTEKYGGHALTIHINYKAMGALYTRGSGRSTLTLHSRFCIFYGHMTVNLFTLPLLQYCYWVFFSSLYHCIFLVKDDDNMFRSMLSINL